MSSNPSWNSVEEVLAVLNDPEWRWIRNTRCKYVELRIDTRDNHCVIRDRDGNPITLEELKYQYKDSEDECENS